MTKRENGAVLILTLVVLLMLTFYGAVSTRDAKTQYQIAGNTQAYSMALSEAEGVLTKAENTIKCLRKTDREDSTSYPVSDENMPATFSSGNVSLLATEGCLNDEFLSSADISENEITAVRVGYKELPDNDLVCDEF